MNIWPALGHNSAGEGPTRPVSSALISPSFNAQGCVSRKGVDMLGLLGSQSPLPLLFVPTCV